MVAIQNPLAVAKHLLVDVLNQLAAANRLAAVLNQHADVNRHVTAAVERSVAVC